MTTTSTQIKTKPTMHFLAVTSLILSILGLLPVLPLVGSIVGIATGTMAREQICDQPDTYSGDKTARAGIILGWIGVGLAFLAVFGFLLYLSFVLPAINIRTGPSIILPSPFFYPGLSIPK